MRKINENSELTEFCGNEVSEILVLSEYSAGQLAAVVVPRGVYVVGAVGVAPRFECRFECRNVSSERTT